MRVATWNVNSIGARLPRLLPWLDEVAPDVVALQETKCADSAFPHGELRALGYESAHSGDGRWNGVAVVSRVGLADVDLTLAGHPEPRVASAQCGPLHVTSVYVPNGRSLDDPHYEYKLEWFGALAARQAGVAGPRVVMGDMNVALTDADVWDVKAFAGSTHVTPAERAGLQRVIDTGLRDIVPRPGKGPNPFTYWDYRAGMFHKDMGMRIDYVLASVSLGVTDAYVDREARKGTGPSDHAPIVVDLDI
ncbi:MAG: exodeoxyribonuclease III [Actinomycetota bacterium]|nr:exodeoxyribonuclease III [Actinomycetota bacterium]